MRLYQVRVEVDVYVIAESEKEAEREGYLAATRGDEQQSTFELSASTIEDPIGLSRGILRSLPYNAPRDHRRAWTVAQWVKP